MLIRKLFFTILTFIVLVILILIIQPINTKNLISYPQPAADYEQALHKLDDQLSKDLPRIRDICKTRLLTHGHKTEKVIVFFHGFTNCPEQFHKLADYFYGQGSNVLIVRIPHHGDKNRMTDDLKSLTAEELAQSSDVAVDIASGLGDKVIVAGSSAGGVMTAWIAQNRNVYKAVFISPNFGIDNLTFFAKPVTNLLNAPNFYIWWDPKLKENVQGADYFYPRYSTRALGQTLRLGFSVKTSAKQRKPQANLITVITNENDTVVDNQLTKNIVASWIKHGSDVKTFEFTKDLKLNHDLIDPDNLEQVKVVYPILEKLIE